MRNTAMFWDADRPLVVRNGIPDQPRCKFKLACSGVSMLTRARVEVGRTKQFSSDDFFKPDSRLRLNLEATEKQRKYLTLDLFRTTNSVVALAQHRII
jgi:hypothetical protein